MAKKGINLKALQPNKPKANIEDYFWLIFGVPKSGKTSLLYKLVKKKFNGDLSKLLLLAFEKGYQTLHGIHAQDIDEWQDFIDTIDQLIDERDDLPYRFIGLDTLDILWSMAEKYVIKKASVSDRKRYVTIGDIPYGAGYKMVEQEVQNQINRLSKAGFGIFGISHSKEKKVEEKNGTSYDKTTVTLTGKARDLFIGMADLVLFVDIAKEKEGDSLVEKRYIYFRSDGTIEAGCRFENVPDRIDYDIDIFLDTFEHAVISGYGEEKIDIEKIQEEQAEQREEKAKEYIEEQKAGMSVADLIAEIKILIGTHKAKHEKEIKEKFKELLGTANYSTSTDAEQLKLALEFMKSLQS